MAIVRAGEQLPAAVGGFIQTVRGIQPAGVTIKQATPPPFDRMGKRYYAVEFWMEEHERRKGTFVMVVCDECRSTWDGKWPFVRRYDSISKAEDDFNPQQSAVEPHVDGGVGIEAIPDKPGYTRAVRCRCDVGRLFHGKLPESRGPLS